MPKVRVLFDRKQEKHCGEGGFFPGELARRMDCTSSNKDLAAIQAMDDGGEGLGADGWPAGALETLKYVSRAVFLFVLCVFVFPLI